LAQRESRCIFLWQLSGELFYDGEDSDLSFCDILMAAFLPKAQQATYLDCTRKNCQLDLNSISGKNSSPAHRKLTTLNNESGIIDIKLTTNNTFR
jgi:hypothetical protein